MESQAVFQAEERSSQISFLFELGPCGALVRPPLADVVVLVAALDLPARVAGVGLQIEAGAVQLVALWNEVSATM